MATLTVQTAVLAGVVPTYNAVAASDVFTNDGKTLVLVKNDSENPDTVTFVTAYTKLGLALADQAVTVAAGAQKIIGPFDTTVFNDANGQVTVTHTQTASVTMALWTM